MVVVPARYPHQKPQKSGRIMPSYAPKTPSTFPFSIGSYAEEVAQRTYPYWKNYIPSKYRYPYDLYRDLSNRHTRQSALRKLKFWLMYAQANANVPKIPKTKIYSRRS